MSAEQPDLEVTVTEAMRRAYVDVARDSAEAGLDDTLIERGLRALQEEARAPETPRTDEDVLLQLIAIRAGFEHLLAAAVDLHRRLDEAVTRRELEEGRVEALQAEFRKLRTRAAARDRTLLDLRRDD